MSVSAKQENYAARVGRWSARHWKKAVFGWLAFVVVAFAIGGVVGTKSLSLTATGPGESGDAQRILNNGFKQPGKELVLVQSASAVASSAEFRAVVQDVTRRLEGQPNAMNVESPLAAGNADRVSADGHSALVEFDIRGKLEDAADKITPIEATPRASPA